MPANRITEAETARMRAMRRAEATIPAIVEATGRSAAAVHARVKDIPFRGRGGTKRDVSRLRRIVAADEVAEIGTRDALAARFGLSTRKSFTGVANYARRVLAEARS